jgi:hypothetical protein
MRLRSSFVHRVEHNDKNEILYVYHMSVINYFKVLLLHKNNVSDDVGRMLT